MASIAIKAVATLATAGSIGGVAYGFHTLSDTTDTVRNYLTKNGLNIAKQNDSNFWDKVLKTYKLEKEGFEINNDADLKDSSEIKAWCDSALKTRIKSKEEDIFKKSSKWCVEYQAIKEKIKDKQFVKEHQKLNDKLEKFSEESQIEIKELTQKTNGEKIKHWCDKNADRSYSKDDERYFKDINANCLEEKA